MKVCDACGAEKPDEGLDPCIKALENFSNTIVIAQCGNGHRMFCVFQRRGKDILRGSVAWEKMRELGGNPAVISGSSMPIDEDGGVNLNKLPDNLPKRWVEK